MLLNPKKFSLCSSGLGKQKYMNATVTDDFQRRHPYLLNPRALFLMWSQVILGMVYVSRNFVGLRFNYTKVSPGNTCPIFAPHMTSQMRKVSLSSQTMRICVTAINLPILSICLALATNLVPVPFAALWIRGTVWRSSRGSIGSLLLKCWSTGVMAVLTWEVVEAVWEHYILFSVRLAILPMISSAIFKQFSAYYAFEPVA